MMFIIKANNFIYPYAKAVYIDNLTTDDDNVPYCIRADIGDDDLNPAIYECDTCFEVIDAFDYFFKLIKNETSSQHIIIDMKQVEDFINCTYGESNKHDKTTSKETPSKQPD